MAPEKEVYSDEGGLIRSDPQSDHILAERNIYMLPAALGEGINRRIVFEVVDSRKL